MAEPKKQVPLRLNAKLYDALAAWAEDDFRSVNGQIQKSRHVNKLHGGRNVKSRFYQNVVAISSPPPRMVVVLEQLIITINIAFIRPAMYGLRVRL